MDLSSYSSAVSAYVPSKATMKSYLPVFRPEIACALGGFLIGMCVSMGPMETFDAGVFVLSKAGGGIAWTANWFVEPKYTGQEDLPPGFRGEAPSLEARKKDDSTPSQCQTVDPSALVCSTVRVSGFSMWREEGKYQLFTRRAFDEIQGRAPFVSEDDKYLAFWCEQAAAWRLTLREDEQMVRDGSCLAWAASTGGVQFKDASGWMESRSGALNYRAEWPQRADDIMTPVNFQFEISVSGEIDVSDEDSWAHASDVTCR